MRNCQGVLRPLDEHRMPRRTLPIPEPAQPSVNLLKWGLRTLTGVLVVAGVLFTVVGGFGAGVPWLVIAAAFLVASLRPANPLATLQALVASAAVLGAWMSAWLVALGLIVIAMWIWVRLRQLQSIDPSKIDAAEPDDSWMQV